MKRKKLILLFLLALPAAVWSQTLNNARLTPSTMPNADQKLVRNWDDQWVVSYHVNATGSYFSCTDYSDFYLNYSMPSSFNDGRSMNFNNCVPSEEGGYINVHEFRMLWDRFAK